MSKTRRRILVVDDNPAIHQDFRKILGSKDAEASELESTEAALFGEVTASSNACEFELDFAFQGEEALGLVRRAVEEGRPYSMAFMDVRMPPGWDGIETTAKLWEVDRDLQVAFCTAYSDYSWESMTGKLGNIDSFVILKKPFEVVEVLQLAHAFTAKWDLAHVTHEHMKRLQESEQRYLLLTNSIPAPVWTAGPNGGVNFVNQHTIKYFGIGAEELLGSQWQYVVHPADRAAMAEQWMLSVTSGDNFDYKARLRAADGTYRWHVCRAQASRDENGTIVQWVGMLSDIEGQNQPDCALDGELAQAQSQLA